MAEITRSDFRPAWWCRNPHLQTLWPIFFRRRPQPRYYRDRLELPDGDFIDLDWLGRRDATAPLVLILHGLEGCSQSHYVRGLSTELAEHGIPCVVMHQRGCSGEPNRLARGYHAGASEDLDFVVNSLRPRASRLLLAGYSLGGNILLKWLGEGKREVVAAAAVSVPLLLAEGAKRMAQGFSRLYQWRLLGLMRRSLGRKFRHQEAPIDLTGIQSLKDFYAFDDAVTAPLHGFSGVQHYYRHCSSRQFLSAIADPTLIIHALDDPLMTARVLPTAGELGSGVRFEASAHGGHCGFVTGTRPWSPVYWAELRIRRYFQEQLQTWGRR